MPDQNPPEIFDVGKTQMASSPPPLKGFQPQEVAEWYVAAGGKKGGPYTAAQIRKSLAAGKLSSSAVVWKQGMSGWISLTEVPEFAPATAPPPLPTTIKGYDQFDTARTGVAEDTDRQHSPAAVSWRSADV